MKKLLFLLSILLTNTSFAQPDRYATEIFPGFTKTTVTYSTVYSLAMDIYQPTGDTATQRPFVLMAHGGFFCAGDKTSDSIIVEACRSFAKRGFVCASINYRLADCDSIADGDSVYLVRKVMEALGDSKAALRYMAQNTATYKVNTNHFFMGGVSAGACIATHTAYVSPTDVIPAYISTIITANGGFEGNSGNPGTTPAIKAIASIAGGLNRTSWISPGDAPMISFHGDEDWLVPFDCGDIGSGVLGDVLNVCGGNAMHERCLAVGVNNSFLAYPHALYPYDTHQPWDSSVSTRAAVIDTTAKFFMQYINDDPTSVSNIPSAQLARIYPNPVSNILTIQCKESLDKVLITDFTGRNVLEQTQNTTQINVSNLPAGMYLLQAWYKGQVFHSKFLKE